MSENLTVKLKNPVTVEGQRYDSLTMRELTVDEVILLERQNGSKGQVDQDKFYFAMSCGVIPEVIGALGQRDWTRLKTRFWETLGNVASEEDTSE